MSQVCFKSVSQEKQDNLDEKARFGNGMNLPGKPHRDMTEHVLNPLANASPVSRIPGRIKTVTVPFSLNTKRNVLTISLELCLLIIGTTRIAKDFAARWQGQVRQLLVAGSHQLNPEAKKEPAFRRDFAPVLFALHPLGTTDTNSVANGH